jgi:hypothetical protein
MARGSSLAAADLAAMYRRYPIQNMSEPELVGRLGASPAGELELLVRAPNTITVSLVRLADGWRVSRISFQPDSAHVMVTSR